ncbi:unnamed protein product [Diatraea saccharalis]|uniref:DUF7869 domain-containing protein n=1 Tax=Diatraea saccharalis TaxID=40085 RepID=A0A9N9R187_9NEOP|nr:unnamed protein product [Diatraea saccharalis]
MSVLSNERQFADDEYRTGRSDDSSRRVRATSRMESQRRLYFKKQIVKELSQHKTKISKKIENENSLNNETEGNRIVTLLGSQSYYDQIHGFPLANTVNTMEKESQDDHGSTTKALLEDITVKDLTKQNSYTGNIQVEDNIRVDIEFESTENTEGVSNKENSSYLFLEKENSDDEQISTNEQNHKEKSISISSNTEKESQNDHVSTANALIEDITNKDLNKENSYPENNIQMDVDFELTYNTERQCNKENSSYEITQKENDNDELTSKNEQSDKEKEPELISSLTEVIAESDMELLRKSLEVDEDDVESEKMNNSNEVQVKSKKKYKRSKPNKSYVDFLSEEEDFAWDSSSWVESGDESSSEENNKPQKRKRKVRSEDGKVGEVGLKKKRKNKRKEAKTLREKGKEYMKKDGGIVNARLLKPNPCIGKSCGNNCSNVSEEKRINIFDYFWGLSSQRKKDWLIGMTAKSDIKRKRSKDSAVRHNTYYYYINDGEGRRKVCKKFLVDTLGVSPKYVSYTLANASYGLSKEEGRGKTIPKNKTPPLVKESAINFIKSLPALPSHYCRKDSTRLYLPTELKNIKNLYRIYKESKTSEGIDVVGEKIFREIFKKEFNIGFHVPKKDKCVKCLHFENQNEKENSEMISHLKEKKSSKDRLDFHRKLSKKNKTMICTSFDLQKVLNTPHGENMLLFYSRKYAVYNLCFYESGTRNGFCYTWGETEGKRGGNEIATILQKYIAEVDSRGSVTNLILYSDSCPGQNKNKLVLAALHNALLQTKHIETIQINYLLPGHTEMTVDSIHATIENSVRNNTIWAPSQWPTVFQLARREPAPYYVKTLTHNDFMNYEEFSEKYFKGNLTGKISKIRVATFKKSSPNVMTVKYSMDENAETDSIAIISRPKVVQRKYKVSLPITTVKYKDLKKLCDTGVIPKIFHPEYTNFPHRVGKDVLIDTDIEDEIE